MLRGGRGHYDQLMGHISHASTFAFLSQAQVCDEFKR